MFLKKEKLMKLLIVLTFLIPSAALACPSGQIEREVSSTPQTSLCNAPVQQLFCPKEGTCYVATDLLACAPQPNISKICLSKEDEAAAEARANKALPINIGPDGRFHGPNIQP